MRNASIKNFAVRDALLTLKAKGNEKAKTLLVAAKVAVDQRVERFNNLMGLLKQARIHTWAPQGYTSRAERVAKELAYLGGEDYEEACRVLKFARASHADYRTAVHCFAGEKQQAITA